MDIRTLTLAILNEAKEYVKSSWIEKIWFEPDDYDDESDDPIGTIYMKTKSSNEVYEWNNVPKSQLKKWRRAKSKGKYFHSKMKLI